MENSGQGRFCPKCGSSIKPGQRFCVGCGNALPFAEPQPEAQQPEQSVNPYAAPAQQEQSVNSYAAPKQQEQSVNPYAAPAQQEQSVNSYAAPKQPEQSVNPYAAPAQQEQSVNSYAAPKQPEQSVNPYAAPAQQEQSVNSYAAPKQPEQSVNPYAAPAQPEQSVNPYAAPAQQEQSVNSYAAPKQPEQNANPYSTYQQPGQQNTNPYASYGYNNGMVTSQSNFTQPKKRSKKPFFIAGTAVVGVAAVAVASVMVVNMLKPSGGPITRIADGAKNLAKANSAAVSLELSAQGQTINFDGSYEIDREKKEVVAVFNGTMDTSSSSYSDYISDQTFKMIIYCKDGIRRAGASSSGMEMEYTEISQEDLDTFFESLDSTDSANWDSLDIDDELSEFIYTDKLEEVGEALIDVFENGEGKEALGITESSENGGTTYNFDINLYDTAKIALDTVEPLFKDKSAYNDAVESIDDIRSTLNSLKITFDMSVDNAGYLSGFDFDCFGVKVDFDINGINNTKVQITESELNDLKNADVTSSSPLLDDSIIDDYAM